MTATTPIEGGGSPWEQVKAEFACECQETDLRYRIYRNGQKAYVRQCVRCGATGSAVARASLSIDRRLDAKPVDEDLITSWRERRQARCSEVLEAQRAERERAYEDAAIERTERYQAHLRSPAWAAKRRLRLEFDRHRCLARMRGCTGDAEHVHHLSYDNLGDEPLFELVSVCSACHHRLHPDWT